MPSRLFSPIPASGRKIWVARLRRRSQEIALRPRSWVGDRKAGSSKMVSSQNVPPPVLAARRLSLGPPGARKKARKRAWRKTGGGLRSGARFETAREQRVEVARDGPDSHHGPAGVAYQNNQVCAGEQDHRVTKAKSNIADCVFS